MEKMVRLQGEEWDLRQLECSFPTGPIRVEKGEQFYFLILESEALREDEEVLDAGKEELARMNAIILAGDPNFRPPTVHGITKKLAPRTSGGRHLGGYRQSLQSSSFDAYPLEP